MFLTRHPELKITLTQAEDEAREHDHPAIGPDHLVVAMLTNVRGLTYRVLTDHGLDYESASARLVAYHADHPAPADPDEQVARDRDALRSVGIDLDAVRDAVQTRFGVDITDDWGERRSGRRRGHRSRGEGGRRDGSRGGRGGGHRGPRSRRGRRPRFTPTLQEATDRLGDDLRERFEESGRAGAHDVLGQLPLVVLTAVLRCEDPALDAALGDLDRAGLLRDVEARIGASV